MKRISYFHFLIVLSYSLVCQAKEQHTFGKTHFIVNYPTQSLKEKKQQAIPQQNNQAFVECSDGICRAYFSPNDNIKQKLIDLINNEQSAIKISIYMFNDKDIAQALIDAKNKRKVDVQVIADSVCMKDRFSKIPMLQKENIQVTVYQSQNTGLFPEVMHNKFVLFSKNQGNKSLVWTGSFNFTSAANHKNPENVVVLDNAGIIQQYQQEFKRLKELINNPDDSGINKIAKNMHSIKRTVKHALKKPRMRFRV